MSSTFDLDPVRELGEPLSNALLQCSQDCIKILDAEGKVQFFNEQGLCIMEIDDVSKVKGVYWPDLWPAESRSLLEGALDQARTSGAASFQAFCPTAKGTPKFWDVALTALPGAEGRYVIISRDITQQHAIREGERRALDRLTSIVDSNADVLWDIDLKADKVWWSEGMQSAFGYAAQEVGDTTQWHHDHIHPADRRRVVDAMAAAISNGDIVWEGEFRYLKADGEYAEVLDRGSIIRDQDGVAIRFVGTMQDVTKRNASATRDRLMAAELAHRVNNTLAVVSGIFQQTLRNAKSVQDLGTTFSQRIMAMANANAALLRSQWAGADLCDLARIQLGPFIDAGRIALAGPDVALPIDVSQALALALNELATNALKYGALSVSGGQVRLTWERDADCVHIRWEESGGPKVTPPARIGAGSKLIDHAIPRAKVARVFAPGGLVCTLQIPLG